MEAPNSSVRSAPLLKTQLDETEHMLDALAKIDEMPDEPLPESTSVQSSSAPKSQIQWDTFLFGQSAPNSNVQPEPSHWNQVHCSSKKWPPAKGDPGRVCPRDTDEWDSHSANLCDRIRERRESHLGSSCSLPPLFEGHPECLEPPAWSLSNGVSRTTEAGSLPLRQHTANFEHFNDHLLEASEHNSQASGREALLFLPKPKPLDDGSWFRKRICRYSKQSATQQIEQLCQKPLQLDTMLMTADCLMRMVRPLRIGRHDMIEVLQATNCYQQPWCNNIESNKVNVCEILQHPIFLKMLNKQAPGLMSRTKRVFDLLLSTGFDCDRKQQHLTQSAMDRSFQTILSLRPTAHALSRLQLMSRLIIKLRCEVSC